MRKSRLAALVAGAALAIPVLASMHVADAATIILMRTKPGVINDFVPPSTPGDDTPQAPALAAAVSSSNLSLQIGVPSNPFTATGGTAPYSWSYAPQKPAIEMASDGTITVSGHGSWGGLVATVTDANSKTATVNFSVTVAPDPLVATADPVTIEATEPAEPFHATGGVAPYKWTGLYLPQGIQITQEGVVTSSVAGSWTGAQALHVRVTDSAEPPATAEITFDLVVTAPPASVMAWGDNANYQLGNGTNANKTVPTQMTIAGEAADWTQVSVSLTHACGIRGGGELYCWGSNSSGQLGTGGAGNGNTTALRVGSASDWTRVSVAENGTCGIRNGGELYCWGKGDVGQNGHGALGNVNTPTRVGNAGAGIHSDWTFVHRNPGGACGIRNGGELYCWGDNFYGQLGIDILGGSSSYPRLVEGGFNNWSKVASGRQHTCAVRASGELYCWGFNREGQLGNGVMADHPGGDVLKPEPVGTEAAGTRWSDWTDISLYQGHTCGIRNGGELYCWGDNQLGKLGIGSTSPAKAVQPTRVGSASDWSAVSAGHYHSCGLRGVSAWCWGFNISGGIGDGSAINASAINPVQIGADMEWASIMANNNSTIALRR